MLKHIDPKQRPHYVKAVMERGLALFQEGRLDSAELLFATLAEERSVKPLVQHMRGVIAIHLGQNARAQELIEEAIQLNPADAEAHANLGRLLLEGEQHPQALAAYAASLALQPGNVVALFGLAKALVRVGLLDLAFDAYQDVLALAPDYAAAVADLGGLLNELGRHDEAVALVRDVLAREPARAAAAPPDAEEQAGAIAAFRDALTPQPDQAELHSLLSFCLFPMGEWAAAWEEYEWRLRNPQLKKTLLATDRPRWQGEALGGKTILLQGEQGFGDCLQFVRYAPMVKARGGRVILRAPEPLLPLLRTVEGIDAVFGFDEPAPGFDVDVPLLSLPRIFGTQVATIPAPIPYLEPDAALVERWRNRLGAHPGLSVGLFWQGNPAHPSDRQRSIRLDRLRPLLDCPGARFFSLQVGPGREQVTGLEDRIANLGAEIDIGSFADAAAIIAHLDLVISVDSAVVHLAGALGKPAFILLATGNDWRWLKRRSDTPWYPQARLFRQTAPGDWDEVIVRVRAALWSVAGAGAPPASDAIAGSALRLAALPQRAADPVLCDALFVEGVRHHGAGDLARSKKFFEQVLRLDPEHVNALCDLGAVENGLGNTTRATALLERAVALAPGLAPARTAWAEALLASGRHEPAIAQYRQAVELAPKSDRAHAAYAMALWRLGDLDRAMAHFQAAVAINRGQSPEFYEALGRACIARGNLDGGEISLTHALALNPQRASAHCALGDLYRTLGREADAAASFGRALAIDPACAAARPPLNPSPQASPNP